MNTNADKVTELAPQVAQEHADYEAALAEERAAKGRLLAAVQLMVRGPALRAISSRVIAAGTRSNAGSTTDNAAFRGVRLGGTGILPAVVPKGQRGDFKGYDLYLTADGDFVEVHYFGKWSGVAGETTTWRSSNATLTPQTVALEYDVDQVLEHLRHALQEQVNGEKTENTNAIRSRAKLLDKVITMLEGGAL